ncbi:MAG: hypothetical protein QOH09_584 [Pseudonocardiales bacterium]|nr:hypothetical protein [Pseudonocardiales bacterium]
MQTLDEGDDAINQACPILSSTGATDPVKPSIVDERRRASQTLSARSSPWVQVVASDYVPWDEARDRPRRVIDMTDIKQGATAALAYLGHGHERTAPSR